LSAIVFAVVAVGFVAYGIAAQLGYQFS